MYRRPPKNEGLLEVWRTVGLNNKIPPKIIWEKFVKFVKLTGHTCACNCLTNFQYAEHAMTGNGKYELLLKTRELVNCNSLTNLEYNRKRKLCELACKNLWKHFVWTYFRRILAIWKHSVARGKRERPLEPPSKAAAKGREPWAFEVTMTLSPLCLRSKLVHN